MAKTAYEQDIHSATRASACPLRRTVDKLVGPPLSKEIIVARIKHGDAITWTWTGIEALFSSPISLPAVIPTLMKPCPFRPA